MAAGPVGVGRLHIFRRASADILDGGAGFFLRLASPALVGLLLSKIQDDLRLLQSEFKLMALLDKLVLFKCHQSPLFFQLHYFVLQVEILFLELISFTSQMLDFFCGLREPFKAVLELHQKVLV